MSRSNKDEDAASDRSRDSEPQSNSDPARGTKYYRGLTHADGPDRSTREDATSHYGFILL